MTFDGGATKRAKEARPEPKEVSMNPDLVRKWKALIVNALVYDDAATSHGTNMEIFLRFAGQRKAIGIPTKSSLAAAEKAEKVRDEAVMKLETIRIEKALLAVDNLREAAGKKVASSQKLFQNYEKFSISQLKDILKSRSVASILRSPTLLAETRKFPLLHALRKHDAERNSIMVPDED